MAKKLSGIKNDQQTPKEVTAALKAAVPVIPQARTSIKAISPGLAYLTSINAVATLKTSKSSSANEVITQPDQAVEKLFGNPDDAVRWGDNNLFPNEWEAEIEKNDTLTDAIEKEVDRIVSGGIEYGYEDITPEGEKVFKYFYDQEIHDFLNHPLQKFAFQQITRDYIVHRLPVPELLFDSTKSKCVGISGIPAAHFRWGNQQNDGYILNGYFNRNWHLGRKSTDADTIKIPVIDPLIDTVDLIRTEAGILKYIYRVPIVTHRTYYALAPAYTAKTSKWLPIITRIADSFDYALLNQMSPKYHLQVDEEWLAKKYGDRWDNATPEEMNQIFLEELQHFNDMMHGVKNTGKNIMTAKSVHKILQKEWSSWTITELKGTVFEKGWIDLLKEGVLHVVKSVGLDPTIQGGNTSSGMGGGSGSDKREAFNIRMATASRHVDNILHVFYFALQYNNKLVYQGKPVVLRMVTPQLQTLNNVSTDNRETKLPNQK